MVQEKDILKQSRLIQFACLDSVIEKCEYDLRGGNLERIYRKVDNTIDTLQDEITEHKKKQAIVE